MKFKYTEGIESLEDIELDVYYTKRVHTMWVTEEGHGIHHIDESIIETELTQVLVNCFNDTVNILPCLSEKQKEGIVRYINEKQ
jgi:hypothetical protein